MPLADLTIAEVHRAVAAHVPERECVVDGRRRTTYRELFDRSRRLGAYLIRAEFTCHRPRTELAAWESGQDHIGIYLYNSTEYLESEFGILSARAAAVNVNYRYIEKELIYLFSNARLRGLIFHSEFAGKLKAIRSELPELRLFIQVPDRSGAPLLPGAIWYEDALQTAFSDFPSIEHSPDDLHILYTGGTTGFPKGVLWRQADILMVALGGRRPDGGENNLADFVRCAEKSASRTLPAGPFMHASGRWPSISQVMLGNTVIIPDNTRRLDADDIWSTVERERVVGINIAGDAFARPLLEQLHNKRYDLRTLRMISSGAAVLSPAVKRAFLEVLPNIAISDTIGASETGPQASSIARTGDAIAKPSFQLSSSTSILSADLTTHLYPGSSEVGWLARSGRVPLGYLGDPERTRSTFPVIGDIRYAVPGDRARWTPAGQIELLGREAATINSGGEKIFAEEVEVALKQHAAVYDAVVCGRPHERWGHEVVALVKLRLGMPVTQEELLIECSKHVARYKLPKAFIFADDIRRSASGKPDYEWARAQVAADTKANIATRGTLNIEATTSAISRTGIVE